MQQIPDSALAYVVKNLQEASRETDRMAVRQPGRRAAVRPADDTNAYAEQQTQIPPFPSSPPLGLSFQYDGQTLEAGLVALPEFLKALGKYIQAVRQAAAR